MPLRFNALGFLRVYTQIFFLSWLSYIHIQCGHDPETQERTVTSLTTPSPRSIHGVYTGSSEPTVNTLWVHDVSTMGVLWHHGGFKAPRVRVIMKDWYSDRLQLIECGLTLIVIYTIRFQSCSHWILDLDTTAISPLRVLDS